MTLCGEGDLSRPFDAACETAFYDFALIFGYDTLLHFARLYDCMNWLLQVYISLLHGCMMMKVRLYAT